MRILLFGEYSNLHHTLCLALRRAGHDVVSVSDGDGWKNYPRDIDLRRRMPGPLGSALYLARLLWLLPRLRGYDVVQIINPVFIDVKPRWNRLLFDYLRRHNRRMSVGCFGDDYYVISRMQRDDYLRYTDFYASGHVIDHAVNRTRIQTWMHGPKRELTQYVMARADCLVACLYEYLKVYDTPEFHDRLHYAPLPVDMTERSEAKASSQGADPLTQEAGADPLIQKTDAPTPGTEKASADHRTHILFAAQQKRGQLKGTDCLEPLFDRLAAEYPDRIALHKIVSVPFAEYQRLVAQADVVVDQLYSFTPAMAALESMRQGKVVISGYETEYASFLQAGDTPSGIINLRPYDDEHNYEVLRRILTDRDEITRLQACSRAFVRRYHDADDVAQTYLRAWGMSSAESSSRCPSHR